MSGSSSEKSVPGDGAESGQQEGVVSPPQDFFVKVKMVDLQRLSKKVMQLRGVLPRAMNKALTVKDRLMQEQECLKKEQECFMQEQERFMQEQEHFMQKQERLVQEKERFMQEKERFMQKQERLGQEQERFMQKQERLAQEQGCFMQEQECFMQEQERLTQERERFMQEQGCFMQEQECFMQEQERLTQERERFMQEQEHFMQEQERLAQEQERQRQERLHLRAQLDKVQAECQREKDEKLLLQSSVKLKQQSDLFSGLGPATCSLLWSTSASECSITYWVADGKLQSFLEVAAQALERFIVFFDVEAKTQTDDGSPEHQYALTIAGTITNIAGATRGRDFLSSTACALLDTLVRLLMLMKPGAFPRLKVLMLMALYNVCTSVKGLKHVSENPGLLPLILTLLEGGEWEVCFHTLRLLQSVLSEGWGVLAPSSLSELDQDLHACTSRFATSVRPCLRQIARQTLEDLHTLRQGRQWQEQAKL